MTMQSDKPLYPCRFCGEYPSIKTKDDPVLYVPGFSKKEQETLYAIKCDKCLHAVYPIYVDSLPMLKEAWNARNERYNPFIKDKHS